MNNYYGKYVLDAYSLGPIEAETEQDAIDTFTKLFGEVPDEIWLA